MALGLPVTRLIDVTVELSPTPTPFANFDTLLIIGESDVINVKERIRSYGSLDAVVNDFGTSTPEYQAARLFFGQNPIPSLLYIGRWAATATHGLNEGGPLSAAEQLLSAWTTISNGTFTVIIDGISQDVTAIDFTGAVNLNGVASAITAKLSGAVCTWNTVQFTITSNTTGPGSTVSFLTVQGTGTDISAKLRLDATRSSELVPGIAAEEPLDAVIILDGLQNFWYFMTFAAPDIDDTDYIEVADFIEGAANPHIFGITTNEPAAVTGTDTTSIGYLLKQAQIRRTAVQWSSTNPYAIASLFARGCTVDFTGTNTAITFMWKQEPLVVPDFISSSMADALDANNYNYYVEFNVGRAIIVNGKTAAGFYIDEIWGVDWLADNIRLGLFNLLYDSLKIPQTDPGIHLLVTTTESSCVQGVVNGLMAPGIWGGPAFGALNFGDPLPKGFYVWAPPVATQSPTDRAARKSPTLMVAAKLAGAVHTVDVLVIVNR